MAFHPAHDHPPQVGCLATCPYWRWDWRTWERRLKIKDYHIRKDIEDMFEASFLRTKDYESLRRLRMTQREHPNRWPRT